MSENKETADQGSNPDLSAELADLKAQLEKVNSKNKELVNEKQSMKLKAQEAKDAADSAELTAAERSGDIEALKAAHTKELQKLNEKLTQSDNSLRTIRVDNAIATAIAEGNVKPEFVKAVTAMMKADVQYENGQASIEGQTIGEYIGAYLGSVIGAHFVRAADSSGSGATGNTSTAIGTPWTKEDALGKRSVELQKLARDKPTEYAAVMATVGLAKS